MRTRTIVVSYCYFRGCSGMVARSPLLVGRSTRLLHFHSQKVSTQTVPRKGATTQELHLPSSSVSQSWPRQNNSVLRSGSDQDPYVMAVAWAVALSQGDRLTEDVASPLICHRHRACARNCSRSLQLPLILRTTNGSHRRPSAGNERVCAPLTSFIQPPPPRNTRTSPSPSLLSNKQHRLQLAFIWSLEIRRGTRSTYSQES
jgi:hypothetical protein